jgi:glycosyltransferase involved in cell wall biosynthesis
MLFLFHTPVSTAYAMTRLKSTFAMAGARVTGAMSGVHFGFIDLEGRTSGDVPPGLGGVHRIPWRGRSLSPEGRETLQGAVRDHGIRTVVGFDLPPGSPVHGTARAAGAGHVVSYLGAPMSSLNSGLRLFLKRVEIRLRAEVADRYVFESEAMRETGVRGRGIPAERTVVVPLGVDLERFHPATGPRALPVDLGIPEDRVVVVFSGHMERRKGVWVLVNAIQYLVEELGDHRFHLLVCGNEGDQAAPYLSQLEGGEAQRHVTFAGYRKDMAEIMRNAHVGAIASTGWDSFTASSVEMMASGLPLLVSDLQGLSETVEDGVSGYLFPPGDHKAMSRRLADLANDRALLESMGTAARRRAERHFGEALHVERLAAALSFGSP